LQDAQPEPAYALDAARSRLIVRNTGTGHIRFTDFIVLQAGRKLAELPVFTVLPGGERYFDLPGERAAGGALRVQAESNAGPIDAAVVVAR
jgi:P pilus assembly chaperone PapD